MKGVPAPRADAEPPGPAARSRPRFVGREAELAELARGLTEAAGGWPSTKLIGGEVGVGKSRLVEAFAELARDPRHGAQVLVGGCLDLDEGTVPYAPLVDALRRLRRSGGSPALDVDGPQYAALWRLVAEVPAGPRAGGADPAGAQLQVFGAVMDVLEQIGKLAPVVLILEDLHWADPSTIDLVRFLTRTRSDQRLLVVCSHRTGDRHAEGRLAALLAEPQFLLNVDRVDLRRFTRPELRQFLVASGVESPSDALVERYFALSDGNALFAELLRTATEETPGTGAASVSERLRAIVLSRYQALPDDVRQLLRVAAVAGQRVGGELLLATSGLPPDRLLAALNECLAAHALRVDNTDRSYVFWHALLREVIYEDQVHPVERVVLHVRMAEAIGEDNGLAEVGGITAKAALAYHWFQAGRKREALHAALDAADAAVAARAFPEALTLYRRVLRLWAEAPERDRPDVDWTQLVVSTADAARWSGEVLTAVDLVMEAIVAAAAGPGPVPLGELYERVGSYQWEAGDYAASAAAFAKAAALMDGAPGPVMSRVLSGLAAAALQDDHYAEALKHAEDAAGMARDVNALAEQSRALNLAGLALALQGQLEEGERRLRASIAIADTIKHLEYLLRGYVNLGVALENAGRLQESAATAREGLDRARELRVDRTRNGAVLANNLAATLVLLGQWDEALEIVEAALPGRTVEETRFLRLTLADLQVGRGDLGDAERTLGEIQRGATPRFAGLLAACEAELAYWRGAPAGDVLDIAEAAIAALGTAENTTVRLQLSAVALRAVADLYDASAGPQEARHRARAGEQADELLTRARAAV